MLKEKNSNIYYKNMLDVSRLSFENKNIYTTRFYPPTNQEWHNSVYFHNKNYIKAIPVKDNIVNGIIKSYFNLTFFVRKKIRSFRRRVRFKRASTNRIFISKALIKHTNNKVVIILFTYNREKLYLLKKILKINKLAKINKKINKKKLNIFKLEKLLQNFRIKTFKTIIFKNKITREKKLLLKSLKLKSIKLKLLKFSFKKLYKKFNSKVFILENLFLYYNKLLWLNNYKYNNFFLIGLKSLISKLYNKNVEFKIINLKKLHLNSDIFLQAIAIKLKNRKNRLIKVLKKALNFVKTPKINRWKRLNYKPKQMCLKKTINMDSIFNKDVLHLFLYKTFWNKNFYKVNPIIIRKIVFNYLNYKSIYGVRLEGKGRLTKRLTASRSIYKYKYKGSIKNIYSSYNGISTSILKGYSKSNVQYSIKNYKTRNGSFGLKGWVSSY